MESFVKGVDSLLKK